MALIKNCGVKTSLYVMVPKKKLVKLLAIPKFPDLSGLLSNCAIKPAVSCQGQSIKTNSTLKTIHRLFLNFMFGQGLPVEFHAVARSVGGHSVAVFELEGVRNKAVKAEAVHFQICPVG